MSHFYPEGASGGLGRMRLQEILRHSAFTAELCKVSSTHLNIADNNLNP